jgi:hypothetical protein
MPQKKYVLTLTKEEAAAVRWAVDRALVFEPNLERQEELGRITFWRKLHSAFDVIRATLGEEVLAAQSYTKRAVVRDRWYRNRPTLRGRFR